MGSRRITLAYPTRITLVVLALLLVGLWFLRTSLAQNWLHSQLLASGVPVTHLEVTSLSPWRASIRELLLANGSRLQQVEADFHWPNPFSPNLKKVTVRAGELKLTPSANALNGRDLVVALQNTLLHKQASDPTTAPHLPEVQLRNVAITIMAANDLVIGEVFAPSASITPSPHRLTDNNGGVQRTAQINAELHLARLNADGWEISDASLNIAGKVEHGDGQLAYRPTDCDELTLNSLRKDHVSGSGFLSVCLAAGNPGPAVSIDSGGEFSFNLVARPKGAQIDVAVGVLPRFAVDVKTGSLSLRLSQDAQKTRIASVEVDKLGLALPDAGITLGDVDISVTKGIADVPADTWSFTFSAGRLHHLSDIPALQPIILEGKGRSNEQTLSIDASFGQTSPGLKGTLHLARNYESGEGEGSFNIPPIATDHDRFNVNNISPLLAQYVADLTGDVSASGKILFNDAWATPLQITGNADRLIVQMQPNLSTSSNDTLAFNFGRSRFNVAIPPLSPHKGQATLDVRSGALRFGDLVSNELTGTINILSFWPLSCPSPPSSTTTTSKRETIITEPIVLCLYNAFAMEDWHSSFPTFSDAMSELSDYVSTIQWGSVAKRAN